MGQRIRMCCGAMLLAPALVMLGGCNGARDTAVDAIAVGQPTGFMIKKIESGREGRIRKYGLFIPRAYSPQKSWPVIVFLHGIGEAGSDPRSAMRVGLGPYVADHQDTFPFIVIFPQSTGGWGADSQAAEDVINILHQVKRDYHVNNSSVSLTGLSTGGYGTFAIGAKYSNEFTALAPMCPSEFDTGDGDALAKMNVWAFENAADPFVAPLAMALTLGSISSAGGKFKHTVFVNVGHDCWEKAYSDGEVFSWFLEQHPSGVMTATATRAPVAAPVAAPSPAPAAPLYDTPGTPQPASVAMPAPAMPTAPIEPRHYQNSRPAMVPAPATPRPAAPAPNNGPALPETPY